jgi:hypothetical protein
VLQIGIHNPGKQALLLDGLRFYSPPLADLNVRVLGVQSAAEILYPSMARILPNDGSSEDIASLNTLIEPGSKAVVQITFIDLSRPLDARLLWSKQTPVIFQWRPIKLKRTPGQLKALADAAQRVI